VNSTIRADTGFTEFILTERATVSAMAIYLMAMADRGAGNGAV
jgi:hypothetical protein